jgi:2-polyprenyl-6-methoxyphenol hydroxylase-like FAD-dependent oxidoreductase
MQNSDVVILGGGIGGNALAAALARDGLDVVVVEASEVYEDRVRGESMMPWGVKEARDLGVEKVLLDAGGHIAPAWTNYHLPDEADPIPVGMIVPDVAGSLNLRHPDACQALWDAAEAAGATVHRGVRDATVELGASPTVRWNGHEIECRLVVGADGRGSRVRKALGIELERAPILSHIAGLLVEGLDIPNDSDFLGGEGDLMMAGFHQKNGRARVYLIPGNALAKRWVGPGNVEKFLADCAFKCMPFGDALAHATPAGPLATYPGDDTWCDRPYGDGAVLVGDAAGYSNPIIGQGLSIAMRDARLVRDILRGDDWSPSAFEPYAEERRERMKRLRFCANTVAIVEAEDADNREARRQKWGELMGTDPRPLTLLLCVFGGAETAPADVFDPELHAIVRAA